MKGPDGYSRLRNPRVGCASCPRQALCFGRFPHSQGAAPVLVRCMLVTQTLGSCSRFQTFPEEETCAVALGADLRRDGARSPSLISWTEISFSKDNDSLCVTNKTRRRLRSLGLIKLSGCGTLRLPDR